MTKTIEEGFRIFHGKLTPTGGESEAAKHHRYSIEECLKKNFKITRFFRTGSFGNGTSIRGYSDVDYFASIPLVNLSYSSNVILRKVWRALNSRFPNTGIKIRTPAVFLPFGKDVSESTEVVPSFFFFNNDNGNSIYTIADRNGGWIISSPDAHNAYVSEIDKRLGNKVKPLIRFLKAWKYYWKVPISSFYIELQVTKYASAHEIIIYSIDIKNIFKQLLECRLAAMQDPMGVSGYIYPCTSDSNKLHALIKLKIALGRAQKALIAELIGKIDASFYWWNIVFKGHFPRYG